MRRSSLLCAILKKPNLEKIAIANQLADVIEFRIDLFDESARENLKSFKEKAKIPVIFTLKGEKDLSCLNLNPDFVDLDYKTPPETFKRVRDRNIKVIASKHEGDIDSLFSVEADIYKAALPAQSILDALTMILRGKKEKRPFIGLCTGEKGEITRILSPFSYAPMSDEDRTAEGQILLKDLLAIYRYTEINQKTDFYGLVGDPIVQSPGHLVHNFAFSKLGINARYIKMAVTNDELPTFLKLAEKIGFKGLSVTIPNKEQVASLCQSDEWAINTIKFDNGRMNGINTDGKAALDLIKKRRVCKKMVILGNGGVALGIAKEALKRGLEVICLYRTYKNLPTKSLPLSTFHNHDYDVLINATPSQDVVPFDSLLEGKLVMDVNLKEGPFLQAAREKNCDVIEGRELFFKQAAYQYEHWFHSTTL